MQSRLILRATELTPFFSKSDGPNDMQKITKWFWIDLIRSRTTERIDYYTSTNGKTTPTEQPFKSFSITFNTDETIDLLRSHDGLITRDYLPARLTPADITAIENFKSATWKLIKIHNGVQFQALRVFTYGKPKSDLTLPTLSWYRKRVYRDLDTHKPTTSVTETIVPAKKSRMTPAQLFDTSRDNNQGHPISSSSTQTPLPAIINTGDSDETGTVPVPKVIEQPAITLESQISSITNSIKVRKQRDFPLVSGWLNRPEFRHITTQLDLIPPAPFPNIYLRMKIRTNHIYHVYVKNPAIIRQLPCITLIEEARMLHFAPIHAPSEKEHRQLYKQFTGANTEKKNFGTWIVLPHYPDLALLSITVPMRDHFQLIHSLLNNVDK